MGLTQVCLCEAGTVTFKGRLFKDSQYVGGRSGSLCNLQRHFLVCWKVYFYVSTCFSLSFLLQESQQETLKLKEEVSRLRQESSDWSTQSQSQEAELQREREERKRELEKEREERTADVQEITEHYKKESTVLNRDF